MATDDSSRDHLRDPGTPSRAAVGGHPIHPMLIALPIGLWVGALGSDLGYLFTRGEGWALTSAYLLWAGAATAALAAVPGAIDFFSITHARNTLGWVHALGNTLALLLAILNAWLRRDAPPEFIAGTGIVLTVLLNALLMVTGWAGGELVYRHKIGVLGPTPAEPR